MPAPRLLSHLVERYAHLQAHPTMLDDLGDLYAIRAERHGRIMATLLQAIEVISILRRRNLRQPDPSPYPSTRKPIMWSHYLRVALRLFNRQQTYTAINILGLAVGLACCLLIARYVGFEWSYDRHHTHAEQIYRVITDDGESAQATTEVAAPLGEVLVTSYPDVVAATRVVRREGIGQQGNTQYRETRQVMVDPGFFDVFDVTFVQGDPSTALSAPNHLLITPEAAARYFGDADPIGQPLRFTYEGTHDFVVTGIVEPFPANSHFQFDFLGPMTYLDQLWEGQLADYWEPFAPTYLRLAEGASSAHLDAQLPAVMERHYPEEIQAHTALGLQRLTDIHLQSNLRDEIAPNGSLGYVYLFAGIAAMILLIACINFMNLTTARSIRRAREVGVRKVLGAYRVQLIGQFLGEALLLTYVAIALAIGLAWLALPFFNGLIGHELSLFEGPWTQALGGALAVGLGVAVVAGSYPALFLSGFEPVRAIKGASVGGRGSLRLRQGLVVVQFGLSIMLVIGILVMQQQLDYMQDRPLGYEADQLAYIEVPQRRTPTDVPAYERAFEAIPGVINVTATSVVPGGSDEAYETWFPAHSEAMAPEDRIDLRVFFVEGSFAETYQFDFIHGRDFSPEVSTDSLQGLVINETAMRQLGLEGDPLGQAVSFHRGERSFVAGRVIGVVKDFHYASLHTPIEPIVLAFRPVHTRPYLVVRLAMDDVQHTLAEMASVWPTLAPEWPLEVRFLDEAQVTAYQHEQRLGRVIGLFTLLALAIACLGLFGLASFSAEQRRKEMGVRKVLGASAASVAGLVMKEVVVLVSIAAAVALPVAYVLAEQWLQDFAYQTTIGATPLMIAWGSVLLIALLAISTQTLRASRINPAEALRSE
ncbi:MAG: ABC transporter permease [Rhodothermales bacterium]